MLRNFFLKCPFHKLLIVTTNNCLRCFGTTLRYFFRVYFFSFNLFFHKAFHSVFFLIYKILFIQVFNAHKRNLQFFFRQL